MMNLDSYKDEELILLYRDSDERAADILVERYKDLVRSKARSMFIIGADKDDLIQEGMIGLYKAIRDYDSGRDASFFTFADLCVSRQILKAVEAGNRKKHSPLNSYISISDGENNAQEDGFGESNSVTRKIYAIADKSPEDDYIDKENVHILEEKINNALSEFERQVLSLHMTGMGYVEIAKVLGKDEKSADNALSRIKTKVKKILEE